MTPAGNSDDVNNDDDNDNDDDNYEDDNDDNSGQCTPDHLGVLAKLCPRIERLHLGLTWPESFLFLSRFRNISHLSVFRVASVENFDLPLMVSNMRCKAFLCRLFISRRLDQNW